MKKEVFAWVCFVLCLVACRDKRQAEDALVIPSVEEIGREEGVVHYRLMAVVWRAVYGQAEVHLDVEVDYGYDEQTRQFVELDACKLKPVFDAEDLALTWHDRASAGDLRENRADYEAFFCMVISRLG